MDDGWSHIKASTTAVTIVSNIFLKASVSFYIPTQKQGGFEGVALFLLHQSLP